MLQAEVLLYTVYAKAPDWHSIHAIDFILQVWAWSIPIKIFVFTYVTGFV